MIENHFTRDDMISLLHSISNEKDTDVEISVRHFEMIKKLMNKNQYDNIVYENVVNAFTEVEK